MIDLHLHTTASDGRLTPAALVDHAAAAGIRVIGVTDHDTTAGLREAADAARRAGLRLVDGIEITAIENGRDVHVLGYFIDPASPMLQEFLQAQRNERLRRIQLMAQRLGALGCPVDADALIEEAAQSPGRTVGRPLLADALVAAGYAASRRDAFDRLLAEGRPAFVPRSGATVRAVVDIVRAARGIASLAHPGLTKVDRDIPRFAAEGLTAIEVWHSDHDAEMQARYHALATELGLAMSGGSDYHADESHHAAGLGLVTLPAEAFSALEARAMAAPRASGSN